jgi:hypothetical protein
MDLARLDALVDKLVSTFEAGRAFHAQWKQQQRDSNHYSRQRDPLVTVDLKCAVSTSLDFSSRQIESAYQAGFANLGSEFATGDGRYSSQAQ